MQNRNESSVFIEKQADVDDKLDGVLHYGSAQPDGRPHFQRVVTGVRPGGPVLNLLAYEQSHRRQYQDQPENEQERLACLRRQARFYGSEKPRRGRG